VSEAAGAAGVRSAVVVVGASRGTGAEAARRFAREGLHVFLAGRTEKRLDAVAKEIEAAGGRATAVPTDTTGATASLRARPPFTAFASAKAALRALAHGMAREFGPRGLHVAHVVIDGGIDGDQLNSALPQFKAQRGADGMLQPDAIADAFWSLHAQHPSAWTLELDLRPYKEPF
jgi:short-subunit dehydrogenase